MHLGSLGPTEGETIHNSLLVLANYTWILRCCHWKFSRQMRQKEWILTSIYLSIFLSSFLACLLCFALPCLALPSFFISFFLSIFLPFYLLVFLSFYLLIFESSYLPAFLSFYRYIRPSSIVLSFYLSYLSYLA